MIAEKALLIFAHEVDVEKVAETSGSNDSPRLREYWQRFGVKKPIPWCALILSWCLMQAGFAKAALPGNPLSACAYKDWARGKGILTDNPEKVKRGDAFVMCDRKTWRGHIGQIAEIRQIEGHWYLRTLEGNSNLTGAREGTQGVRRGHQGDTDAEAKKTWRKVTPRIAFIRLTAL